MKPLLASLIVLAIAALASARAQDAWSTAGARVVEVFGDKAIIDAIGERLLVEALSANTPFPAAVGSRIDITGRRKGNIVIPERVTLPSGDVLRAAGSPPAATAAPPRIPPSPTGDLTLEGQLAREGITPAERPYRKRGATEVVGRTADGRMVIASFDPGGRLREIEDAEHPHVHPNSPDALSQEAVERRLAAAGYTSVRLLDQRRYRFVFSAVNAHGEAMEIQVDRGGTILKRVWLR